jgi:queuine tRNA-ribosyltransferase
LDGYSIGGLSVGEPKEELFRMLGASIAGLPRERPRYLMGVGSPEDLWKAVSYGVDMFDCVHPTRVARRGAFFTRSGRVNVTAARFRSVFEPVDQSCDCYACRTFSAAYVHHLFRTGEMLGQRLATIHNLHFFQKIMGEMRDAIRHGNFSERYSSFLREYQSVDDGISRAQRNRWNESRMRKTATTGGRDVES